MVKPAFVVSSTDVRAITTPALLTILMASGFEKDPMFPVVLPIVACPPLKVTLPKSARGSTPPLDGASAIHSAEACCALATEDEVENDQPAVPSVIVTVKDEPRLPLGPPLP